MPDANLLQVKIVVDSAALTSGMQEASSTVTSASEQMAAALNATAPAATKMAASLKSAGMAAMEAKSAMTNLGFSAKDSTASLLAAGYAAEELGIKAAGAGGGISSMERAMAMASARMAGMGAGAGMLGGALGRVAATSSTLAPLLAAAFPVVAIIAFVDIAELAYQKILEVTSGMVGWDKEAKAMNDLMISLNQQMLGFNANLAIEKLRLNEVGLKGAALDRQKQIDLTSELRIRNDELTASIAREASIRKELQGTEERSTVHNRTTGEASTVTITVAPDKDTVTRLNKELDEAIKNSQTLVEKIEKIKQVSLPQDSAEARAKGAVEQNKLLNDTYDQGVELQHKLAEADLRTFNEKERQLKEVARLEDEANRHLAELEAKTVRETQHGYDFDLRNFEALAAAKVRTAIAFADYSLAAAKINTEQATQLKLQALQTEYNAEKLAIQKRIDLLSSEDPDSPEKRKELYAKLLIIDEQYQAQRLNIEKKAATEREKAWDNAFKQLNQTFSSAIHGLVTGTEGFGTAFVRMIDDITAKFIEGMARMAMEWVATHVFMLAIKKSIQQQEVLSDAKAAAAAAWKAVVGIPIIGPILAPIAAATAFAGVEAFSAQGGWDMVPAGGAFTRLHAREMVLPAHVADAVRSGAGAGGSGGEIHLHVHANDARSVRDMFRNNSEEILSVLRTAQREFKA